MFLAIVCSAIFGASMPGFSLLFGEMINGLGDTTAGDMSGFKDSSFAMLLLGVVMWFFSWA